ncbi:MAG: carboxypeptidase regulatory-like domain-containing protein [Gemmatimonadetes bacterium]|nr:carboxypeptidase regulatory-like domain-containing protein [Gemmatimonadota bacterium]MBI3504430.1 carboxypeptidase regulatory-like domain-containing protein [Pseudomonadota bacterium]
MRRIVRFALLALATPVALAAQESAELRGRIWQNGDTSIATPGAELQVVGTPYHAYAARDGRYRIVGIAPGDYDVRVRLIEYQPALIHVRIAGSTTLDVPLSRLPQALTEVRISGKVLKVPARFEDVYRRGATGVGRLITRDDIERMNPYDTKQILATQPGVLVTDRGLTFQRCQSDLNNLDFTFAMRSRTPGQSPVEPPRRQGNVQVYVDGVLMSKSNDGTFDAATIIDNIPPVAIQVIEVYSGVSRIPGEFLNDACAVVAIWTKAY